MIPVVDRVPTYPNRIKITRQDGSTEFVTWERADEPVVEGTPINKALFDSIAADIGTGLSANKTIYVTKTGSDALGDGSNTNPYATVQKAINTIPSNLNGYDVTINIGAGAYNEDVLIARKFGGNVILTGVAGAIVQIGSLRVSYGAAVRIENIALQTASGFNNNAIAVTDASFVCTSSLAVNGGQQNGIYVNYNGYVCVLGDLSINQTTYAAINVTNRSSLFANTIDGSAAEGMFLRSANGSLLAYGTFSATAPTVMATSAGGKIYSNAQTSVPNY